MSFSNMSHLVPMEEHKFERGARISDDNINEIVEDDINHRIEDAQRFGERIGRRKSQKEYEKRKKKLVTTLRGTVISIIFIVISACVYTFLKGKFKNIDVTWFGFVVLGALVTIAKNILEGKRNNDYRPKDVSIFEGAWNGCKIFLDDLFRNDLLTFLVLVIICLGMGGLAGKFNIFPRLVYAGKAFANGFVAYGAVMDDEQIDEQNGKPDEMGVKTETVDVVMQRYEGAPDDIKGIKISPNDKTLLLKLSDEERDEVFLQGEGIISDWDDQQKINAEVRKWINEKHAEGFKNRFDDFAPRYVKNEISEASDLEKEASSFREVQNVLQTREDVYVEYPKKSIADLISNGYHRLALILLCNAGQDKTILYLYSQSILWNFEVIKYTDVSDSTMKDRLNRIAQRYEDISLVCADCEDVIKYATKLQIAFEDAADQY